MSCEALMKTRRAASRRRARPAPRLVPAAARVGRPGLGHRRRPRAARDHRPRGRGRRRGHQPGRRSSKAISSWSMSMARASWPPRPRRRARSAFVHISAIGADPDSQSEYGRTKGLGEQAVRSAFPSATIIRPSIVFGPEDNFTNRFASMARFPVPAGDRAQDPLPAGVTSAISAGRSPRRRSTPAAWRQDL